MATEESSASVSPQVTSIIRTTVTIIAWYAISNLIILTTKWLFNNHFQFPLTVTFYSNFISSLWAALLSRHPRLRAPMPSKHQLRSYILPIGCLQAMEIGCSNLALKILTVSFGTILKGGAPIFTFLWGLLFRLERFSWPTFGCLITMAVGIALASLGEGQEFQLGGFCLQLFATALGGLRWAMTHKLLQHDTRDETNIHDEHSDDSLEPSCEAMSPLTTSLYTQPVTALFVLPFALIMEISSICHKFNDSEENTGPNEGIIILATMTGIATLVFCLLMSEYWLVAVTSSLAMSVAATFKELLTIGGGMFFFSEKIYLLNVIGFCTCQVGIFLYMFLRLERPATESYMSTPVESTPMDENYPRYIDDDENSNGSEYRTQIT